MGLALNKIYTSTVECVWNDIEHNVWSFTLKSRDEKQVVWCIGFGWVDGFENAEVTLEGVDGTKRLCALIGYRVGPTCNYKDVMIDFVMPYDTATGKTDGKLFVMADYADDLGKLTEELNAEAERIVNKWADKLIPVIRG